MTVDPTVIVTAILVAVLIAMSAFYSAAETSITSSSRARMFQLEKEGDRGAGSEGIAQHDGGGGGGCEAAG